MRLDCVRPSFVLLFLALLHFWTHAEQGGRNRVRVYEEALDCSTPQGIRQVLCSREDTAIMCRFFNEQSEGASFELPSLGSGVTMFVMVDAAVSRVKYMARSSSLAQTIRSLSANEIPDAKRISMRMYLQIPESLDREELILRGQVPTVLSKAMPDQSGLDLLFSQTGDGQVEITSLARVSRARILDSFEVCGSWVHTVDGLILPSSDNTVTGIPDFVMPKKPLDNNDSLGEDTSPQLIASGLLGGIAVLLGTLCLQYSWARYHASTPVKTGSRAGSERGRTRSHLERRSTREMEGSGQSPQSGRDLVASASSEESEDLNLQASVDRAVSRALEKWASSSAGQAQGSTGTRRPHSSQPQALSRDTSGEGAERLGGARQAVQGVASSSLSDLDGSRGRTASHSSELAPSTARPSLDTEGRPILPPRGSSGMSPPVDSDESGLAGPRPPPSAFKSSSSADERAASLLQQASGLKGAMNLEEKPKPSGYAESQAGTRFLQELAEGQQSGAHSAQPTSQEITWETVQAVFDRVQDRSWQLNEDDLTVCLRPDGSDWILGSGGFGRVYKGILHGSTPVAIKFITRQTHKEKLRFVSEIHILKNLRHVNITQFMGAHIAQDHIILASEFMARGDLWTALNKDSHRHFNWYDRGRALILDVVRGLVFMHSKSMVHLDLKTSNILLSRDGTAKIADVGLARILTQSETWFSSEGTFEWAAPEILMSRPCSDKADIYSLGVIMWEVLTGEAPKLRRLRNFKVPEECPQEVADIAVACRAAEPNDRPSARQLFQQLTGLTDSVARPAFRALSTASSSSSSEISEKFPDKLPETPTAS